MAGGGWYGGYINKSTSTDAVNSAMGGSGHINTDVVFDSSMENGVRSGNGKASINLVRTAINVPSATNYVYDGNTKTGVPSGTGYSITGNTAINAGSYTATVTPDSTHCWTDGTTGSKTISWSISQRQCTAPSISGWSGTYNGSAHYIVTNSAGNYGTLQYKVGASGTWTNGNPNTQYRTDVGTTTIYARRVGDANNITSSEVSASITISARQCTAPSISGWSGTYDGSAHYIVTNSAGNYGTLQYKVGASGTWTNGNPNTQYRTDVGTTTIYARRLGDSNNTTSAEVSASITISKANGYVNLSSTSGRVRYGTASTSFTISSHHGGSLSVSDNHATATCALSGSTVTISSLGGISAGANESVCPVITVTVTSAATTNYYAASATYTLKIVDDVAPTGSISVNNTRTMKNNKKAVGTRNIGLAITYSDAGSSVDKMAVFETNKVGANRDATLSNINSLWENPNTSKSFNIATAGDGEKIIYLLLKDTWGNITVVPTT